MSKRGGKKAPAEDSPPPTSRRNVAKKYQQSSSSDDDSYAGSDDDIASWIVDDVGVYDDSDEEKATSKANKGIMKLVASANANAKGAGKGAFDDFNDFGTVGDLDAFLGDSKKDSFLDNDFDVNYSTTGGGNDDDAGIDIDFDDFFQATTNDFSTGSKNKGKNSFEKKATIVRNLGSFDSTDPSLGSATTTTAATADMDVDAGMNDGGFDDMGDDDDFQSNTSTNPTLSTKSTKKPTSGSGSGSTTTTTGSSAASTSGTPLKQMTGAEQNALREFDQKKGIAILGKINQETIVYEHELMDSEENDKNAQNDKNDKNDKNASKSVKIDQSDVAPILTEATDLSTLSNYYVYIYSIYEDNAAKDGRVYLFGRLLLSDLDQASGSSDQNGQNGQNLSLLTTPQLKTKSICICVDNVQRSLFFLPRKFPLSPNGKVLKPANFDATQLGEAALAQMGAKMMEGVKNEVDELMKSRDIDSYRMLAVSKEYCFGRRVAPNSFPQPGERGVKRKRGDGEGDDESEEEEEEEEEDKEKEEEKEQEDQDKKAPKSKSRSVSRSDFYRDESLQDSDNMVPRKATYLNVKYSFSYDLGQFGSNLSGTHFSHVFGTQTTRQESLILDRGLKGPCWITIPTSRAKLVDKGTMSWCDFELTLSQPNHFSLLERDLAAPYFTSVSLSIKTAVKLTANNTYEKQIVMATVKTDFENNIELSKTKQQQLKPFENSWTVIAPPNSVLMPFDWKEKNEAWNKRHAGKNCQLRTAKDEKELLMLLLNVFHRNSPDIIISHDLHGSVVDILISRFNAHKLGQQWSKLGRLKRSVVPKHGGWGGGGNGSRSLVDQGVGAGRLMVDTQLMAREFYPSKQYTLDYLTDQLLGNKIKTVDQLRIFDFFSNSASIFELIAINTFDSESQSRLMHNLDIIPLTKQLTNLCGNTWHSSLRSSRAERVEFLLLHAFCAKNFIPPEPANKYKATPFNTIDLDYYGYDVKNAGGAQGNGNTKGGNGKVQKNAKGQNGKNGQNGQKSSKIRSTMGEDDEEQEFFDDNTLVDSDDEENSARQDKQGQGAGGTGGDVGGVGGVGGVGASKDNLEKKKKYAGGKVLEPKRGFYSDWIAVLDFNSLYPSIIREYNLCFTTTQHWGMDVDVREPNFDGFVPSADAPPGLLPDIVRMLIERRRAVRQLIPRATSIDQKQMYHIKQLAFKLVANSLYGCLGFQNSRFYCVPIAACVTSKGRQALDNAVATAGSLNAQIIYGDTDSIMVNTQMQSYKDARAVAIRLKNGINKQYKMLNIDEDGYFKNMLLLRKKKYAALKLERVEAYDPASFSQLSSELAARPDGLYHAVAMPNVVLEGKEIGFDDPALREKKENMGAFVFKREVKGLDMVRRDWSELCRKASSKVIDIVLKCETGRRDEVVGAITGLMRDINELMTQNSINIDDYVITKQLTRSLEQYQDFKKLPHVYVAWKASQRGKIVRAGDVVEFVMTTSTSSAQSSSQTQSDRAVSKEDYVAYVKHMANEQKLCEQDPGRAIVGFLDFPNDLKLDLVYYKESQLLTPIMRLVEVLDEISTAMLADCIGLDSAKYALRERRNGAANGGFDDLENEEKLTGLSQNAWDQFADLAPFYISCPRCHVSFPFLGAYSYVPYTHSQSYLSSPQSQRERMTYWTLPFQMHTIGYQQKLNECQFDKTGFICPTPHCPGLFDFGHMDVSHKDPRYSTTADTAVITNYLCNAVDVAIRATLVEFEKNQFVYTSKDLHNGSLAGVNINGNHLDSSQFLSTELMSNGFEPQRALQPQDLVTTLQYYLHLFDFGRQRIDLQRECDARLNRNLGSGTHSKSMLGSSLNHANGRGTKGSDKDREKSSLDHSLELYQKLETQNRLQIKQALLASKGQGQGDFETGTEVGVTEWKGEKGETNFANLNSEISLDILMVFATVHQHIKDNYLDKNAFFTIDLAKLFAALRVEA